MSVRATAILIIGALLLCVFGQVLAVDGHFDVVEGRDSRIIMDTTIFNNTMSQVNFTFNSTGGYAVPYFTVPHGCSIVNTTLDVTWTHYRHWLPYQHRLNASDMTNVSLYNGTDADADQLSIDNTKLNPVDAKDRANFTGIDNNRSIVYDITNKEAYEVFSFWLLDPDVVEMTFHWRGQDASSFWEGDINMSFYNYTDSSWEMIAKGGMDMLMQDTWVNGTVVNCSHFLGPTGDVDVMIVDDIYYGGANPSSMVRTNYFELNVTYNGTADPVNVSVDIGDDGIFEFKTLDAFRGTLTFNNTLGLNTTIQQLVDASSPGMVVVPINVSTNSTCHVVLDALQVTYKTNSAPTQVFTINGIQVFEDSSASWVNVLNVSGHFDDPDGDVLRYNVSYVEDPGNLTMWIVPGEHWVQCNVTENHNGDHKFKIGAYDAGADGIWENEDDAWVESNLINIEVFPVNDVPVIHTIGGIVPSNNSVDLRGTFDAVEDSEISFGINATDVDHSSLSLFLHDEPDGMTLVGTNVTWTPTNDQVGLINFTINASDMDIADEQWTLVNVTMLVANSPDPPKLTVPEIPKAYEDQLWTLTVTASDIDLKNGDQLAFTTNRTDGVGDNDIDGMELDVNGTEATLSFTPGQEHVGWIKINLSVTDRDGLFAFRNIPLQVINTNDAPVGILTSPDDEDEFTEGDTVLLHMTVIDPDLDYGDTVAVTWRSNVSGIIGIGAKVNWTAADVGPHMINVTVDDDDESVEYSFNITVLKDEGGGPVDPNGTDGGDGNGTDGGDGNGTDGNSTDGTDGNVTDGGEDGEENTEMYIAMGAIGAIVLILIVVFIIIALVMMRGKKEAEDVKDELDQEREAKQRKEMEEKFAEKSDDGPHETFDDVDPDAVLPDVAMVDDGELMPDDLTLVDGSPELLEGSPEFEETEEEMPTEEEPSAMEATLDEIFSFDEEAPADAKPAKKEAVKKEPVKDDGGLDWGSISEDLD